MAVKLGVVSGLVLYLPVIAAVEVLENVDVDGFSFLVGEFDLEGFVEDAVALIDVEVGLAARAFHIERVAGADLDGTFGGGVVDGAFADELHLAIAVAAIEPDATSRQGNAEVVCLGVLELLSDLNFGVVGVQAVASLLVRVVSKVGDGLEV